MLFKNQILKVLAIGLILNGASCIGNDGKSSSNDPLPNPFPDQSTESPVADLVTGWELKATITNVDDNEFCDSITESLAEGETVTLSVADTGECLNKSAVDDFVTETCKAAADNLIYQFDGDYSAEECKIRNVEIFDVTLQDDGTLAGTITGYASVSGCVDEEGAETVSGECYYTGTVVGEVQADVVDNDQDGFTADVDCNDDDASINSDATEIADNGVDEDCDGADLVSTPGDDDDTGDDDTGDDDDSTQVDSDQDGFTADVDCNDDDASINSDATEIADNGVDEDCDGVDLTSTPGDDDDTGDDDDSTDCLDGDASCDPDLDNDGLCDLADNCDGNAIDPNGSEKNDWYWVDYEDGKNTGNGGFADYQFIDGTKDGSGEIFVFGVVEGFKDQTEKYSFCAGTHQSAMIGVCVNATASSSGTARTVLSRAVSIINDMTGVKYGRAE